MIVFRYEPVSIQWTQRFWPAQELFEVVYPSHHEWLTCNNVPFEINYMPLPDFIAMKSNSISTTLCEFEIGFEDKDHAVMFKLFSGMTNDT